MVFDAKLKQFLCDAKQKKGMVKKGHIRNSKFVKKLGNANQNRMGAPAACCIPFKIPFKKCFKIVFLSLWRRDPVP